MPYARRKGFAMSRKTNEAFINQYMELDKACCSKFGISNGGVGEYINRLNNARFAPDRDEVLPRLVRYRNIHKRFYYEPGAMRKDNEVASGDIKWIVRFRRDVIKKKDPISQYLRRARRYAFRKKATIFLWIFLILGIIGLGATLFFVLASRDTSLPAALISAFSAL